MFISGYYCEDWIRVENSLWLRLRSKTSLVAQTVKSLPAMRETWVQSLGQEDPLEKEMATHSNTLVWKIPWMEEPGRLQSMGLVRIGHNRTTSSSRSKAAQCIQTMTSLFLSQYSHIEIHNVIQLINQQIMIHLVSVLYSLPFQVQWGSQEKRKAT